MQLCQSSCWLRVALSQICAVAVADRHLAHETCGRWAVSGAVSSLSDRGLWWDWPQTWWVKSLRNSPDLSDAPLNSCRLFASGWSVYVYFSTYSCRAANQYRTSVFCTDFTCKIREYEFGLQNTEIELCQFCHLKYCCQNKAYLFG